MSFLFSHALYSASKKRLATSSTIVGPTALELPRPTHRRRSRMNEKPKSKRSTDVPYNATIDPLPSGDFFASATEALRSEMNVSTTCNVNRYPHTDRQTQRRTTRKERNAPCTRCAPQQARSARSNAIPAWPSDPRLRTRSPTCLAIRTRRPRLGGTRGRRVPGWRR